MDNEQKKKVLIFSLGYYPKHIGGAEVAVKEITDRLADDFEFHLICNRYDSSLPKTEQIGPVMVHRIGLATHNPSMADLRKLPLHLNKIWFQFAAFWKAKKLHHKHNFQITWAMMAHATGVPATKFKKKFPEVGYVLTLQEGDPPEVIEKKMRMFGQSWHDVFRTPDVIQVISHFLGRWAKQKGFTGDLVRIPNAVHAKHFSQSYTAEELAVVRQELDLNADDVALVTTSRLVKKNGIDDVIRSLVLLPQNVKFVIFGTGPDQEKLQTLAHELGVSERVIFYGFIDHVVMPKYLKACTIFIRPSRSEGMGNSFIEAMAAQLPVIATQEGGIADFLFAADRNPDQKPTGWAVDPDSPEQIAAAVEYIVAHPDVVEQVVQTAYKMAVQKYDWERIATEMHQLVFRPLLRNEV